MSIRTDTVTGTITPTKKKMFDRINTSEKNMSPRDKNGTHGHNCALEQLREKRIEQSLANIFLLRQKAMSLASDLAEAENKTVPDGESSISFLHDMSVGQANYARLSLKRTVGELLRERARHSGYQ